MFSHVVTMMSLTYSLPDFCQSLSPLDSVSCSGSVRGSAVSILFHNILHGQHSVQSVGWFIIACLNFITKDKLNKVKNTYIPHTYKALIECSLYCEITACFYTNTIKLPRLQNIISPRFSPYV